MAVDSGDREEESPEDIPVLENVDPLAELAADLALCILYLEDNKGGFCDYCTCQLQFHCRMDDGGCELCGCIERAFKPERVVVPAYDPGPGRAYDPGAFYRLREANTRSEGYNRAKEARKALKELTE